MEVETYTFVSHNMKEEYKHSLCKKNTRIVLLHCKNEFVILTTTCYLSCTYIFNI